MRLIFICQFLGRHIFIYRLVDEGPQEFHAEVPEPLIKMNNACFILVEVKLKFAEHLLRQLQGFFRLRLIPAQYDKIISKPYVPEVALLNGFIKGIQIEVRKEWRQW